jgi:hypothetical protein
MQPMDNYNLSIFARGEGEHLSKISKVKCIGFGTLES